jgi:hypothetical protein
LGAVAVVVGRQDTLYRLERRNEIHTGKLREVLSTTIGNIN